MTVLDRFQLTDGAAVVTGAGRGIGADDRTPRHLADMPDRQWDYQLDLNLRAVFTGARAAARVMEDGGSIINISSGAAIKPSPYNGPYSVAKAGVDSLTRTLSVELAPKQIRVNGVAPGPVPTEVFMEFFNASEEDLPGLTSSLVDHRTNRSGQWWYVTADNRHPTHKIDRRNQQNKTNRRNQQTGSCQNE